MTAAPIEKRSGARRGVPPAHPTVNARDAFVHSLALVVGCLVSYSLATHALAGIHSLSRADDLVGGLWAVIATVFVIRATHDDSVLAAKTRMTATALSFALCFVYLLFLPFHPWGLATLVGVGTLVLAAIGRSGDAQVAGITTAVVLVAAALSPHEVWQQPLLRAADTTVGTAVGLATSWVVTWTLLLDERLGSVVRTRAPRRPGVRRYGVNLHLGRSKVPPAGLQGRQVDGDDHLGSVHNRRGSSGR